MYKKFKIVLTVIFLLFLQSGLNAQYLKPAPMIDLPGNNTNFSLATIVPINIPVRSFIVWVNKKDSVYSILLKKDFPEDSSIIVVASDRSPKANPCIAQKGTENGLRITWQEYSEDKWKLCLRNYTETALSNEISIIDTLTAPEQYALGVYRIVWINNKKLLIKEFEESSDIPYVVEGSDYSEPIIKGNNIKDYCTIMVIKRDSIGSRLHSIYYTPNMEPKVKLSLLARDTLCANPSFCFWDNQFAYKTYKDSVWKVGVSRFNDTVVYYTETSGFNCNNPVLFTTGIPIKSSVKNHLDYFSVVYDSDSIKGNKEVFVYMYLNYNSKYIYNISKSPGDDEKPQITGFNKNYKFYTTYLWEHTEKGKTDIWRYDELYYSLGVANSQPEKNFQLEQNYPNPFNPSTTIKYNLQKAGLVTLKIHDCIGRLVSVPVNEFKYAGSYNINFKASGLSSGVYFYEISVNGFKEVKSMLLLK